MSGFDSIAGGRVILKWGDASVSMAREPKYVPKMLNFTDSRKNGRKKKKKKTVKRRSFLGRFVWIVFKSNFWEWCSGVICTGTSETTLYVYCIHYTVFPTQGHMVHGPRLQYEI